MFRRRRRRRTARPSRTRYRRSARRLTAKRRSRRARRSGAPGASFVGSGRLSYVKQPGFYLPDRVVVKQRYVTYVEFTPGVTQSGYAGYVMSANSVFDPDESSTGDSVYGYDNLTRIYQQYRVNAVKMTVQFINPQPPNMVITNNTEATAQLVLETPTGSMYDCGITACPDSLYIQTTWQREVVESGWSTHKLMPVGGPGSRPTRLKMYTKCNRLFGVTPTEYRTNAAFLGDSTTSPPREGFLEAWVQQVGPNQSGLSVYGVIRMTYYCTYLARRFLQDV